VKEIAFQIYELAFEESSRLNAPKERFKFSTARIQVESNIEWLEKVLDLIEIHSFTSVQSFIIASATHELAVLTDLKPFLSTSNPTTFYVLFYRTPSPSHPSPFSRIPSPVTPRDHLDNDEWRSTVQSPEEDDGSYFVGSKAAIPCLLKAVTESGGKCTSCFDALLLETIDLQKKEHIRRVNEGSRELEAKLQREFQLLSIQIVIKIWAGSNLSRVP